MCVRACVCVRERETERERERERERQTDRQTDKRVRVCVIGVCAYGSEREKQ